MDVLYTGGFMDDGVRISLAAAMTIGLERGLFYRDARLGCINLLEAHEDGCAARCAYCGLTRERPGPYPSKGFIRVRWPTFPTGTVLEAMKRNETAFRRVCISMITRSGSPVRAIRLAGEVRRAVDAPVSVLVSPTVTGPEDLAAMMDAGVDRIGIAVDAATEGLFDQLRGRAVRGPHRWDAYWGLFASAVRVFGERMVGCHLIVGLGETERQMAERIQHVRDIGGRTHLFSFFPEPGSRLEGRPQPPAGQYRRIQVARWIVDEGIGSASGFRYGDDGRIISFGLPDDVLDSVLVSGRPFETSGCPGRDGAVACNRPFANSRPGPDLRNYPFPLEPGDVDKARSELWL